MTKQKIWIEGGGVEEQEAVVVEGEDGVTRKEDMGLSVCVCVCTQLGVLCLQQ